MPTLYVFAHTHWDREWYQPFETFRVQLVDVARKVITDLEKGALDCFYLDGQSIVIEDIAELAPELVPRIKSLVESRKLAVGPWYVLPDQMLVGGESLIRNLKLGLELAATMGPPCLVGYNPDTFGHTQDLPCILKGFGIDNALVWRGVPPTQFGPVFLWRGPDRSEILAYHFVTGYYQTLFNESAHLGAEAAANKIETLLAPLVSEAQIAGHEFYDKIAGGTLLPAGADHTAPPENMNALVAAFNAHSSNGLKMELVRPDDFLDTIKKNLSSSKKGLMTGLLEGELRDNRASSRFANAYLLPGVLSTRLYLKQQNRSAELRLTRFSEPLFAMFLTRGLGSDSYSYPQSELNYAWKLLLKNHPHDSICGTSVDEVHREMEVRYARVHQVLDAVETRARNTAAGACGELAADDPERNVSGLLVVNPGFTEFTGPVPVKLFAKPGSSATAPAGFQKVSRTKADHLFSGFGRIPYYKDVEILDGWIFVEGQPPLSQRVLKSYEPAAKAPPPCKSRARSLENGLLRVDINTDGKLRATVFDSPQKFRIFELNHTLRDVGDGGDTYNFDPIEDDKPVFAKLVSTRTNHKGPHVSSVILEWEMKIPQCLNERSGTSKIPAFKRSTKTVVQKLETELTLKRGVPVIFFQTRWNNQSNGHRLEAVFSTGRQITRSFSENHFSIAARDHDPKKSPRTKVTLPVATGHEAMPDRYPCQRFFVCAEQLFLNHGLPEYGVEGQNATITLLRSVNILSRGRMRTRGGGAGPHLPTPGASCLGPQSVDYGWAALPPALDSKAAFLSDQQCAASYDLAGRFDARLLTAPVDDSVSDFPPLILSSNPAVQLIALTGGEAHDTLILRLLNTGPYSQETNISFSFPFRSVSGCMLSEKEHEDELFIHRDFSEHDDRTAGHSRISLTFGQFELKTLKIRLSRQEKENPATAAPARKPRTRKKSEKVV